MDISNALIAKSDQLNSTDLIGGPQTVSIVEVVKGSAEQPVNIITDVFGKGRPFKPSKTVLRILASAWGKETAEWVGKSMTLYRDASVRWGGEEIGGIRVAAMSHIDKATAHVLPTSKGKFAKSVIQPLAAPTPTPPRDWLAMANDAPTSSQANAVGHAAKSAGADEETLEAIRGVMKEKAGAEG